MKYRRQFRITVSIAAFVVAALTIHTFHTVRGDQNPSDEALRFAAQHTAGLELSTGAEVNPHYGKIINQRSSSSPKASVESKKARTEYFQRIFGDPATGQIPANAEARAREYARKLPTVYNVKGRSRPQALLDWQFAGPNHVGGRTRALAVDVTDPKTILAAGVSGGIYKSTDKGENWRMVTQPDQLTNITSIAQDPREGYTNTWYAVTGEIQSSAGQLNGQSINPIRGSTLLTSTDGGENWSRIEVTAQNGTGAVDDLFNYATKIVVHPETGALFTANTLIGIMRSEDGGSTFELVMGEPEKHWRNDVIITGDGTLVAALSKTISNKPDPGYWKTGIYISRDHGDTWRYLSVDDFPAQSRRTVLAAAPSNPDRVYAYTLAARSGDGTEDVRFYAYDLADSSIEDRSDNLPDYDWRTVDTQFSYNMSLAVHPANEELVLLGATVLFRSFDGFATYPEDDINTIIGGYFRYGGTHSYPESHSDYHALVPDPSNPDAFWTGSDGGVNYIPDITDTTFEQYMPQSFKNNGYHVTQFYHVSQPAGADRLEIIGGTQDNGTPFFTSAEGEFKDISRGDGGYSHFGLRHVFFSTQKGFVGRRTFSNDAAWYDWGIAELAVVSPAIENPFFIHPYLLDPLREEVMFYPARNQIARNRSIGFASVPDDSGRYALRQWHAVSQLNLPSNALYTALGMARQNSADRLYLGVSVQGGQAPALVRVDNAMADSVSAVIRNYEGWPAGSFIFNVAVHPRNPDEVAVVMANFNVNGLWHSTDGGETFSSIEGNLLGGEDEMGPSIRSLLMQPTPDGTLYFAATSAGLYSTNELNGSETVWALEAPETIGRAIGFWMDGRTSDGRIVFGTHGRGAFTAYTDPLGQPDISIAADSLTVEVMPGDTAIVELAITNSGDDVLYFGTGRWYRDDIDLPVDFPGIFGFYKSRGELFPGETDTVKLAFIPSAEDEGGITYSGRLLMHSVYEVEEVTISVSVLDPVMTASNQQNALPAKYTLRQNYPNPFNPSTTISFDLPQSGNVRLSVYTIGGELVDELINGEMAAGTHTMRWRAEGLSSGIYLYRIASGSFVRTKKMMFLK